MQKVGWCQGGIGVEAMEEGRMASSGQEKRGQEERKEKNKVLCNQWYGE